MKLDCLKVLSKQLQYVSLAIRAALPLKATQQTLSGLYERSRHERLGWYKLQGKEPST